MNQGYTRLILVLGLALSFVLGCGDDSEDTTTNETDVVESSELPFYGECQSWADCYAGDAVPSTSCFEFACQPAEEGEGNVCAEVARAVNSPCTSDSAMLKACAPSVAVTAPEPVLLRRPSMEQSGRHRRMRRILLPA